MDRYIVEFGAVPLDIDQLQQTRNTHIAMGRKFGQLYGAATTSVGGFEVTAGSGLQVLIEPGQIVSPGTVDDVPYGSLPADPSPAAAPAHHDGHGGDRHIDRGTPSFM